MKNKNVPNKLLFHYDHFCTTPNKLIKMHKQPSWELSVVLKGSGMRHIGDHHAPFTSGDMVLIKPETMHCWNFDDSNETVEYISIMFSTSLLEKLSNAFADLLSTINYFDTLGGSVVINRLSTPSITRLLLDMDGQSKQKQLVTLLNILVSIAESEKQQVIGETDNLPLAEKRLKDVELYVRCNVMDTISIDDVSAYVGMNRSSFCSMFKRMTGKTFIYYLNEYRISIAKYYLLQGNMTVSQICFQTGFNDVVHFNHTFKRFTGVSPREYIKQNVGNMAPVKELL